jgi:hypothetical protein
MVGVGGTCSLEFRLRCQAKGVVESITAAFIISETISVNFALLRIVSRADLGVVRCTRGWIGPPRGPRASPSNKSIGGRGVLGHRSGD